MQVEYIIVVMNEVLKTNEPEMVFLLPHSIPSYHKVFSQQLHLGWARYQRRHDLKLFQDEFILKYHTI